MTAVVIEITGVHPYADKFPMLPESELAELAESIQENGLRHPIVITTDGLILDGRNRAAACERLAITPTTITYEGDDLAEYVIDCNTSRRHMSTGARAMSTALVLLDDGRRESGRWRRGSVVNPEIGISEGKTWQNSLNQAGVILDFKPDLAAPVVTGELALDAAYQQAKAIKDSAERDKIMARACVGVVSYQGITTAIKTGRLKAFPAGEFEAVTRSDVNGKPELYVRYIGGTA